MPLGKCSICKTGEGQVTDNIMWDANRAPARIILCMKCFELDEYDPVAIAMQLYNASKTTK